MDAGVWLINYSCRINSSNASSTLTQYSMWVNGTTGQSGQYGMTHTAATIKCGTGNDSIFGTAVTVQTYTGSSNSINIAFFGTGTLSGTLTLRASNNILTATRIA